MSMPANGNEPIRGGRAAALILTLCAAIVVGISIVGAPLVLLPAIAADLGVSVSLVGQVSTSSIFLTFIIAVVVGPLIQRHGYRRLYLAGTLAMASSAILYAS